MAGSSKAELLLALTAMFAAIVGLVVARLVPSVHVATPVVVVQGGLWAIWLAVHLRHKVR